MFLNHYYNDMAGSVLRGDYTLYMILGYLLLFRLDELGFDEFRQLTSSEDPIKMAHLLTYLTNRERVQVSFCVPRGCPRTFTTFLRRAQQRPMLLFWTARAQESEVCMR